MFEVFLTSVRREGLSSLPTLSGLPAPAKKRKRTAFIAVTTVVAVVLAALGVWMVVRSQGPKPPLTAAQLQCTLMDVGDGFRVNRTANLTAPPGEHWVNGIEITFDNTTGEGPSVACVVFSFSSTAGRDADYTTYRDYAAQSGQLVQPPPPTVGEDSFYFRSGNGTQVLYGVEFLRGNFAVLINVASGPPAFPYYDFTSRLAQRIAAK